MSKAFGETRGEAKKSNYYKFKDGDNKLRFVGGVLPRYVYWVKHDGKTIPMECLGFDRDREAFTNTARDYVREYMPDLKCGWAYLARAIDMESGEIKTIALKKTLFQEIQSLANKHLGDPTDVEKG